jgi:predicted DNA-binding transcriptional regulator AlpA
MRNDDSIPDSDSKPTTYLRVAQVRQRYGGASDMWITRRLRDDAFPAPYYLGGTERFWDKAELDTWDRERLTREPAKRNPAPPPPSRAKR